MTELLRTQFALDDSQYFSTVEVLPGRQGRRRAHRADQHPRRAQPSQPLLVRRRLRHGYRGARHHRVGRSPREYARPSLQRRARSARPTGKACSRTTSFRSAIPRSRSCRSRPVTSSASWPTSIRRISVSSPASRRCAACGSTCYSSPRPTRRTRSAVETTTDNLLIPGISLASVPQGYLGEALFSRGFFAELRGSHHVFGSDSDFLQLDVQMRACLRPRPRLAPAAARRSGCEPGRRVQQAARLGALLRRRRPQRARLRLQRALAGGGSPCRIATGPDDRRDGSTQDSVKVGGKHLLTGTVEIIRDLPRNLARRDLLRHRQCLRQVRRSARVFGGRRRSLAPSGRDRGHRHRAAAVGAGCEPAPAPEFLAEAVSRMPRKLIVILALVTLFVVGVPGALLYYAGSPKPGWRSSSPRAEADRAHEADARQGGRHAREGRDDRPSRHRPGARAHRARRRLRPGLARAAHVADDLFAEPRREARLRAGAPRAAARRRTRRASCRRG